MIPRDSYDWSHFKRVVNLQKYVIFCILFHNIHEFDLWVYWSVTFLYDIPLYLLFLLFVCFFVLFFDVFFNWDFITVFYLFVLYLFTVFGTTLTISCN